MTDVFTKEKRSYIMSRIRSKDTGPERIVRSILRYNKIRFKSNVSSLPGTPDIVLKDYHAVIFINGCFWHGHHRCRLFRMPKSRKKFWRDKITKNRLRDKSRVAKLRRLGWRVITVWECGLDKDAMKVMEGVFKKMVLKNNQHK